MKQKLTLLFLIFPLYIFSQWEPILYGGYYDLSVCVNGDTVYVANDDSLFYSIDHGDTWNMRNSNMFQTYDMTIVDDIMYHQLISSFYYDPQVLLKRYDDWGLSFSSLPTVFGSSVITTIVSNQIQHFLILDFEIMTSENDGLSWHPWELCTEVCYDMATTEGYIFIITQYLNRVYRSDNNGLSWQCVYVPNNGTINNIKTYENDVFIYSGTKILYSNNNGNSWISLSDNLPENQDEYGINEIYLLERKIFIRISTGGIYMSDFSGSSWEDISRNIPADYLWRLTSDSKNFYVIDTESFLLWRAPIESILLTEENQNLNEVLFLNQNFPNPFSNKTMISFSIPHKSNVLISLFDSQGQLMKVISNKVYSRGEHFIQYENDFLHSGVYWLVMEYQGQRNSTKMIKI